jgi:hypothetical protein
MLDNFKNKFDDKELYALLKISQLYKDKKYFDSEKILKDFSNISFNSASIKYYLLQVLLLQEKFNDAISLIKIFDEYNSFKLGLVSAIVTLLKKQNKKQEITHLFSNIINNLSKTNPDSKELEIYLKENSNFQIESANYQQACEMLEKMRSLKPNDFRILSKLINVYSKFDKERANRFFYFFLFQIMKVI